jgi:putative membrane protein
VILLIAYHLRNHWIFNKFQKDEIRFTSNYMRIWNEGATIILFAIVFLVILKTTFSWVFGVMGIIGLGVLLMLGIKLYKRIRKKNPNA